MKGRLKDSKIFKKVMISVASLAVIGAFIGGARFYGHKKYEDYNSTSEVVRMAEDLDCDISYLRFLNNGKIRQLKHNNGEPIYVSISDEYSDMEREAVINSLDHAFGVVNYFNDKYTYSIVDEEELTQKSRDNKTTISYKYEVNNEVDFMGLHMGRNDIWARLLSSKILENTATISLNMANIYSSDEYTSFRVTSAMLHEALHTFGFDDVYTIGDLKTTDKFYGNTIMYSGDTIDRMKPNDFLCLASLYAPKFSSEKERQNYIDKVKEKHAEYTEDFYRYYMQRRNTIVTGDLPENLTYEGKNTERLSDGTSVTHNYKVNVKNGEYEFFIYDDKGKLLDSTTGQTDYIDGMIFLKNVTLKTQYKPLNPGLQKYNGYVTDFAIFRLHGSILLQNLADKTVSLGHQVVEEIEEGNER